MSLKIWSSLGPDFEKFRSLENILNFTLIVFQRHHYMTLWRVWRSWRRSLHRVRQLLQQNGNCWKVPEEFSPSQHKNKKSFRFPAELLQLIFFYLPLGDLKTLVLVCKRWNVGERSKLWEKSFLLSKERSRQNSHSCPIRRQLKIINAKMCVNWKLGFLNK